MLRRLPELLAERELVAFQQLERFPVGTVVVAIQLMAAVAAVGLLVQAESEKSAAIQAPPIWVAVGLEVAAVRLRMAPTMALPEGSGPVAAVLDQPEAALQRQEPVRAVAAVAVATAAGTEEAVSHRGHKRPTRPPLVLEVAEVVLELMAQQILRPAAVVAYTAAAAQAVMPVALLVLSESSLLHTPRRR
jgi:hypothetical protein